MRRVLVVIGSLAAACTNTPEPTGPTSSSGGALTVSACRAVAFDAVPPVGAAVVTVSQSGSSTTPPAANPPGVPAATTTSVFPGTPEDYASSIVAPALSQRDAAIIGCARTTDR